jgi:ABC-type antimicrobial peptide transport system permease subunit
VRRRDLAALGVYGVVSYSVAGRGREMGIRIALGARPGDIHRLVVVEGLMPVAAGVAAGLAMSWGIGRGIGSLLFDVRPGDPAVMAAAAAIVTPLPCSPAPDPRGGRSPPRMRARSCADLGRSVWEPTQTRGAGLARDQVRVR